MRNILLATCLATAAPPAWAAGLELHRVMLSAAGVGYFEYGAHLDGPGTLGLDVPLDQVDDVLRSLAVFDSTGSVGSIELPGRDNLRAAFADVPFTETQLGAPQLLLNSLRGEQIEVTGPVAMTGRIVGTSPEFLSHPLPGGDMYKTANTRVTLLTADGFRQFILEDATAVKLTDAALQAKVGAALDAARQQAASTSRHLTLRSQGAGPHDITAGYVAVAPLWKASYRVILPQNPGDPARVQGWAVLENQSGADWRGVDLTLQSGNPVTFHQAIYASYYADRPEVPVEVLGRLLPDADSRGVTANTLDSSQPGGNFRAKRSHRGGPYQEANPLASPPMAMAAPIIVPGPQGDAAAPSPPPPLAQPETAEAQENPTDTSFHIASKIDLPRGHTASVPIIDRAIPAEQLDWLQASSTRPVSALRITNDSKTSLPAGVLTLYAQAKDSGAAFAGDARLSGLPAGQTRLLAFAEDLRTTAERSASVEPDLLVGVKMADGVLTQSLRRRMSYSVTLTAPTQEARQVLVEFPKNPDEQFTLGEGGKPQDATATAWRVLASLQAGQTQRITAYADTDVSDAEILLPQDGDFQNQVLAAVLAQGSLDPAARAKLQTLADLRAIESTKRATLARLIGGQDAINQDEDRLRKNLAAVTAPGNLRDQLLAALAADEASLARLRNDIASAQQQSDQAYDALVKAVREVRL